MAKKSRLEVAREKAAQANALLQKLEAQARARESSLERQLDARKKAILGDYILGQMGQDREMKNKVLEGLDRYLMRAAERTLFGLPPKPEPMAAVLLKENTPAQSVSTSESLP
ncbi:hypothetical protein BH10PSE16_BH10PSE16_39640 [soil metagenome]